MQSTDAEDWSLLRQYAKSGSQAAFDELVRRHINLVYSTCKREVGDAQLAEDTTQVVFLILARKARMMLPGTIVSRWLFKTAMFTARSTRRREARMRVREQDSGERLLASQRDGFRDQALEQGLNEAIDRLNGSDWLAIKLRFYDELSLAEIGERFGIPERTAQKRVYRAVDRVRRSLTKNGIGLAATSMAAVLTTEMLRQAPAAASNIGTGLSISPLPAAGIGIHHLTKGVLKAMFIKNAIAAGVAVTVVAAGVGVAPIVAGSIGDGQSSSSTAAKIAGNKAKIDYLATVHAYNRMYANLYRYGDPKIVYSDIHMDKNTVTIKAYSPSIAEIGKYLEKIYNDPDFTKESIDHLPGYPEDRVYVYRLDGKLIGVEPVVLTADRAKHRIAWRKNMLSGQSGVDPSLAGYPGYKNTYRLVDLLKTKLGSAHSDADRLKIETNALNKATMTLEPRPFKVTIIATLKKPLS